MRPERKDPLRIDIRVAVKKGFDSSPEAQQNAIRHWAQTGRAPKGYRITTVQWQNPARKDPTLRNWRTEPPEQARQTLWRFLRRGVFEQKQEPTRRAIRMRRSTKGKHKV